MIKPILENYHRCPECDVWHDEKQTYIITKAEWGTYDHYGYCLMLDFRREGSGFFSFFTDLKQIQKMIEDAKVSNIQGLIGKPCWCYIDEKQYCRFVRMWAA